MSTEENIWTYKEGYNRRI